MKDEFYNNNNNNNMIIEKLLICLGVGHDSSTIKES